MNRRQFLVRATIGGATVPLLFTEIGCGDDDDDPSPDGGGHTFESEIAEEHQHSITIPNADLNAGGDRDYTSTSVSGHQHRVVLAAEEMQELTLGCVLTVLSTGGPGSHEHTWRILVADRATDLQVTSSEVLGHSHGLTVPASGLVANPPVQQDLTTGQAEGHTHTLTLDVGDWTTLQECATVTKSTLADPTGHSHSYTITRT